ncbi:MULTISPECIES: hypothetical protein [Vibrio harveyi group]|uniref:hypothetical protein n=1 Tax=Vibrio harveyi group TaxID=717610 RepID=UPI0021602CC6|nr:MULTISPECIES: hypothetical protein [Vibrio harveyi group]MCS0286860.1 hypothetical protein [Vibrio alginolyticus]
MSRLDAIGAELPDTQDLENTSSEEQIYETAVDEKSLERLKLREEQVLGLERRVLIFESLYKLRKKVALFIFFLIFFWLLCVMVLVFLGSYEVYYLQGNCGSYELHSWYQKVKAIPDGCAYIKRSNFLNLSESIVIALISTTTANVLGLSYIVAKWLFPKHGNDSDSVVPVTK